MNKYIKKFEMSKKGYTKMISGEWHNSLGSVMSLEAKNNTLKGKYFTVVGNVKRGIYNELHGTYQITKLNCNETCILLNWIVQWTNIKDKSKPPSSTSWSGQVVLIGNSDKAKEISSMWILRRYTTCRECWDGLSFGKDVFKKTG